MQVILNQNNLSYFSDKPSPPQNFRVKEVYKDYIVVAWDASESDGGSPITGYTVEKRDVKKTSFIKAATVKENVFELKVAKLVEGNEYVFHVYAENAIGQSEPTTMEPVKARLPFGAYYFRLHVFCLLLTYLNVTLQIFHGRFVFAFRPTKCTTRLQGGRHQQDLLYTDLAASRKRWRFSSHWLHCGETVRNSLGESQQEAHKAVFTDPE